MNNGHVEALRREMEGYIAQDKPERAAAVRAELARLGVKVDTPKAQKPETAVDKQTKETRRL